MKIYLVKGSGTAFSSRADLTAITESFVCDDSDDTQVIDCGVYRATDEMGDAIISPRGGDILDWSADRGAVYIEHFEIQI